MFRDRLILALEYLGEPYVVESAIGAKLISVCPAIEGETHERPDGVVEGPLAVARTADK